MSERFPKGREEKRKTLLEAVERVSGVVTGGADEAEALGTLPVATVEALAAAGLFTLKLPAELGGAEADPVTQLEVVEAITYLDPSAGWCAMIGSTSIGLLGAFLPDEAVAQVFAEGQVPTAALVFMPTGKAAPVDGGYRVSGRWPFASGIRHSQWLAGGAMVDRGGNRPPEHRVFVFPVEAAEIHDNWQVAGLQGTGSCDFSLPERFVPEAFTWDHLSGQPQRGGPLYHLGRPGFTANEHTGFALGVGRKALDTIIQVAEGKRRGFTSTPSRLATRPTFQRVVGECDLRLRAARALALEVFEEAWATVTGGETPEQRMQAEMRAVAAFATEVAVEVTTHAFRYGGASALYRTSVLQRCLRDINAAAQHLVVSDAAFENLGQFALGLPDASPWG